jgi:hypothetical protein
VQSSRDFDISRENAIQSLNAGLEAQLASGVQADIYRSAGKAAMTSALFDAAIGSVFAFKAGTDLMTPSAGGGSPYAPIEERSIGYGMS